MIVIGWNEYVALPEWGISALRAKIDTGARSSALHVENIVERPRGCVRFDVILSRKKGARRVQIEARIVRRGRVRSSTGEYGTRIFVKTKVRIGPIERDIEFSLVDRERMIYRALIGRSALGGQFLIDVGRECLHGKPEGPARRRRRSRT